MVQAASLNQQRDNQNEYAKRQPELILLRHDDLALPQVDAENRFYVVFLYGNLLICQLKRGRGAIIITYEIERVRLGRVSGGKMIF